MAKVTQNAFGISLKKKKMKITVQCGRNTQQTRAGKHSHCLLKISKKKKKNQLVSRDPNVTSHCPTNTIQKVPNFSTFMRPHSILQCLVSVVKSAHIYKHVRQQFIYLTWKQLAFSPPQFHLTLAFFFFFFLAMQHPTADDGLKTMSRTFSAESFGLPPMCTIQNTGQPST